MNDLQLVIKRTSWKKGEIPAPLKPYAGRISHCPKMCKGKKGQAYRLCLKQCALESYNKTGGNK